MLQIWRLRASLKDAVRRFFRDMNYLEVETPVLVACPGTEAHLEYFASDWLDYQGQKRRLWLRSSPELHMKQILAQGADRIFQFAASFRNCGELSPWHHPEFLLLEWYHAGIGFSDFIDQTEAMIRYCYEQLKERFPDLVLGCLPERFCRMSVEEAFYEFAGIRLQDQDPELASMGKAAGINSLRGDEDFETAFFKVLLEKIEPALARQHGVVLSQYPPSQAALAVIENARASRFEFYWRGVELCNGFKELLGEKENRKRIHKALAIRAREGRKIPGEDEDFYRALSSGIPECCGNALGLDRLLALILGRDGISSVLPFRAGWPWVEYPEEACQLPPPY